MYRECRVRGLRYRVLGSYDERGFVGLLQGLGLETL